MDSANKIEIEILAVVPVMTFPIFSWLVRLFQGTKYSHYAISYNKWVLDSTISGTVWTELPKFRDKYKLVKKWKFQVDTEKNIFEWSAKYSAKPYSLLQNLGVGLKWMGVLKSNPFGKDEAHLNCSELIALWARDYLKIEIQDSDNYGLIETEELLDREIKNASKPC